MGKPTGFLDYEREDAKASSPKERIKSKNARQQDVWIVACHFAKMVK